MPLFLSLSLALPAVLFAAYQVKRLSTLEWNSEWSYEKHHKCCITEGVLLQTIYWMCLIVALMLVIMDFAALFNWLQDSSLLLPLSQAIQRVYTNPGAFLALLCFLTLTTIIFLRQREAVLDSSKNLASCVWYVLLELPVRLLLDPPYRGLQTLIANSSHNNKVVLNFAFYALLYITLAAAFSNIVWDKVSALGKNSMPPAGLMYVLFYLMAFMANAIGTVFNWFVLHLLGILFVVKCEEEEEETEEKLPLKSVRRIYYTVYYR